ncbi:MAG TPA: carboxylesterase family protein [Rhizomicrobium sp.]|nr:carboxylesterase family protein [Rhizomicrobium sp.]
MTNITANTTTGKVRGSVVDGVCRFYGVPYAAAPVGGHRFTAPVPHPGWSGERDATQKAPNAPQIVRDFPDMDTTPFIGNGWRKGDDYLIANIWTPDLGAKRLPVMVFIHGGAWVGGTSDCPAYDGTSFAKNGVVLITINYRMGIEGVLPLEGAATNICLRDMIAALKWVQHNAESFGGDPGNVTVFGESAGAMSIGNLIASPMAKGLFRRAIVQSGHGAMLRTMASANVLIARLSEILSVPATAEGFRARSMEECARAVETVSLPNAGLDMREPDGRDRTFGLSKFLPLVGDDVVPVKTIDALAEGAGADVEILIGSCTEEMNIYFVPTGVIDLEDPDMATMILGAVTPQAQEILANYGFGKDARAGTVLTAALTDLVFRDPVRAFALAHRGRAHVYEFGWRSPAFGGRLGACHALELPFAFNTLASCTGARGFVGPNPPQELAQHTHDIWLRFAKDGSLPWDEFNASTRQVYRLDEGAAAHESEMIAARYRM